MDRNGGSSRSMLDSPTVSSAPVTAPVMTSSAHSCHTHGDHGAIALNVPDYATCGIRAAAAEYRDALRNAGAAHARGTAVECPAGFDGSWSASTAPEFDKPSLWADTTTRAMSNYPEPDARTLRGYSGESRLHRTVNCPHISMYCVMHYTHVYLAYGKDCGKEGVPDFDETAGSRHRDD